MDKDEQINGQNTTFFSKEDKHDKSGRGPFIPAMYQDWQRPLLFDW